MSKYDKQAESKEQYVINRNERIKDLLKVADVGYETYLEALASSNRGFSVVQARDLDEIYINSYNIEWLRAWNANLDIQPVLDYFAVITYVTDYYAKDDTGTLKIIEAAVKQCKEDETKDKMKAVANTFQRPSTN